MALDSSSVNWGILSRKGYTDDKLVDSSKKSVAERLTLGQSGALDATLHNSRYSSRITASSEAFHSGIFSVGYSTPMQAPRTDIDALGVSDCPFLLDELAATPLTSNADAAPTTPTAAAVLKRKLCVTDLLSTPAQRTGEARPLPITSLSAGRASVTPQPNTQVPTPNALNDTASFVRSIFARSSPGLTAHQHQATPLRPQCPPTPLRTPASAKRNSGTKLKAVPLRRADSLQDTKLLMEFVPPEEELDDFELEPPSPDECGSASTSVCDADSKQHPSVSTNGNHARRSSVFSNSSSGQHAQNSGTVLVFHPGLFSEPDSVAMAAASDEVSFDRDFTVCRELGHGSFNAVVEAVFSRDKRHYAVKRTIKKLRSKKDREMHWREMQMFSRVKQHPHIVTYFRAWQEDGHMYFQMDLCSGGTVRHLQDTLPPGTALPEATVWTFIAHVASALAHMHQAGIVHLDIKPENVFIDNVNMKVGDLGLAIDFKHSKSPRHGAMNRSFDSATSSAEGRESHAMSALSVMSDDDTEGDCRYMAPELLNVGGRAPPADIFSLGISAFELAWDVCAPQDGEAWHDLREGRIPAPREALGRSKELCDLITALITPDPEARPSAHDILQLPLVQEALTGVESFLLSYYQSSYDISKTSGYVVVENVEEIAYMAPPPPGRLGHLGRSESYNHEMISGDIDVLHTGVYSDVPPPLRNKLRPPVLDGIDESGNLDDDDVVETPVMINWDGQSALSPLFRMPPADRSRSSSRGAEMRQKARDLDSEGPTRAAHATRSRVRAGTDESTGSVAPRRNFAADFSDISKVSSPTADVSSGELWSPRRGDASNLDVSTDSTSLRRPLEQVRLNQSPIASISEAIHNSAPARHSYVSSDAFTATGKRLHGSRHAITTGASNDRVSRNLGFERPDEDAPNLRSPLGMSSPFVKPITSDPTTVASALLGRTMNVQDRHPSFPSPISHPRRPVFEPPLFQLPGSSQRTGDVPSYVQYPISSSALPPASDATSMGRSCFDDMRTLSENVPKATPLRPGRTRPKRSDSLERDHVEALGDEGGFVGPSVRRRVGTASRIEFVSPAQPSAASLMERCPSPLSVPRSDAVLVVPNAPLRGRRQDTDRNMDSDDMEDCRSPKAKRQQVRCSPPTVLEDSSPTQDGKYMEQEGLCAAEFSLPSLHMPAPPQMPNDLASPKNGYNTPAAQGVRLGKQHWYRF